MSDVSAGPSSDRPVRPTAPASPIVSALRFSAADLPADEGFEAWRRIMARMFDIERGAVTARLPSGGLSAVLLGDLMGNRSSFSAQHLTRDRRRIDATPDHLVLQFYRSGGFVGDMDGRQVRVGRGQVAICDLRRPLDVEAVASDTLGLTIPRHLFASADLDRLGARLDPSRERLLATRMTGLHRRLPGLAAADVPAATADLLAALRRLFDPSVAADALDGPEFDADVRDRAERFILGALASPDLSPETIAARLKVSRATLYRVFAPLGGVMQHVWTLRLEAVRATLESVSTPRTLARLASEHGFKTAAHLSRSFRLCYGATPSDWRAARRPRPEDDWHAGSARLDEVWRRLGRAGASGQTRP